MGKYADLFRLDGRVILVTGGTVGIGLELARATAAFGARVAIAGRTQERCDRFVDGGVTVTQYPDTIS